MDEDYSLMNQRSGPKGLIALKIALEGSKPMGYHD